MKGSVIETTDVLPYYFPLRANKLLGRLGLVDVEKLNQIRFQNHGTAVKYPLHPLKINKPEKALNIVILCIDSWNPRTFTRKCTPNICAFADHAELFSHHLSASNATSGGISSDCSRACLPITGKASIMETYSRCSLQTC